MIGKETQWPAEKVFTLMESWEIDEELPKPE